MTSLWWYGPGTSLTDQTGATITVSATVEERAFQARVKMQNKMGFSPRCRPAYFALAAAVSPVCRGAIPVNSSIVYLL